MKLPRRFEFERLPAVGYHIRHGMRWPLYAAPERERLRARALIRDCMQLHPDEFAEGPLAGHRAAPQG